MTIEEVYAFVNQGCKVIFSKSDGWLNIQIVDPVKVANDSMDDTSVSQTH